MARLHVYPHAEPQQDMVIVADPAALRAMAAAMLKVAQIPQGFQRVKMHTSDGHEYTVMIVSNVSEAEWQTVAPAYQGAAVPALEFFEDYRELQAQLAQPRSGAAQKS